MGPGRDGGGMSIEPSDDEKIRLSESTYPGSGKIASEKRSLRRIATRRPPPSQLRSVPGAEMWSHPGPLLLLRHVLLPLLPRQRLRR